MKLKIIILILFLLTKYTLFSQTTRILKPKYQCWIYTDSINVYTSFKGFFYNAADSGITYAALKPETYLMSDGLQLYLIKADKIEEIKVRRNGNIGRGKLIGGIVGFLIGGFIGVPREKDKLDLPEIRALTGAIILSIPGMIIGGIAGAAKVSILINRNQNNYAKQKNRLRKYAITGN